jgi:TRAP-type transport system periplasmic protein
MRIHQGFSLLLILVLSFCSEGFVQSGACAGTQKLVLAHIGGPGSMYDLTAQEFARRVNASLGGRFEVEVAGDSALGNEQALFEKVQNGGIYFCLSFSPLIKLSAKFEVFDLPYLVLTRDHIRRVRDELLAKYLEPEAQAGGLILLGMWENGFRHVTTNARPIGKPADLRGSRMRVPTGSWRSRTFQIFGAEVSELPVDRLYFALKNGEVDGQENPLSNIVAHKLYEVQRYLSLTAHTYQPVFLVANESQFRKLPPDVQEVIQNAAKQLENWALETGAKEDPRLIEGLKQRLSVNEVDKFAFLIRCFPIYQAFARDVPGGASLAKLLYDPVPFSGIPGEAYDSAAK